MSDDIDIDVSEFDVGKLVDTTTAVAPIDPPWTLGSMPDELDDGQAIGITGKYEPVDDWIGCGRPIAMPSKPSAIEEASDNITVESPVFVHDYESTGGEPGFRVCAPYIPGCVVIHRSRAHALRLVATAAEVVHAAVTDSTKRQPMAWSKP